MSRTKKFTLAPRRVHTSETDGSTTTSYCGTRSEAMDCINAQPSSTRFLVYVHSNGVDAEGDDIDMCSLSVSVQISKPAMLCAAYECMSDAQEARGALIPFMTYETKNAAGVYRAFYLF